jgi:hypothetical protein
MSNSGTKLHAKNAAIYLNAAKDQSGALKVAAKASFTLNLGRDYVDATTFGDANKTYLTGLRDISGQWEGFVDVSGDLLVNASAEDIKQVYLYGDDRSGFEILLAHGPALFDAVITASVSDGLKANGNFRASGSWTVFTG